MERDAMVGSEHGHPVSTDLVGEVSVGCHPIGADEHPLYPPQTHHHGRHRVRDHRVGDPRPTKFPSREPCTLEKRTGFVDEDMDALALGPSPGDHREGAARAHGGQRTRVAVREQPIAITHERRAVAPHRIAQGHVFAKTRQGLAPSSLRTLRTPPRDNPVDDIHEIDRRGACGTQPRRRALEDRVGDPRAREAPEGEPRSDPDERRPPHGEVANVLGHARRIVAVEPYLFVGQEPLIEHGEPLPVVPERDGVERAHRRRVYPRCAPSRNHRGRTCKTCYTRRAMSYHAEFVCFEGCGARHPLDEVVYRCRNCGALLDVAHDVTALRALDAEAWKTLFTQRWRSGAGIDASGVWGKREWVYPTLDPRSIVSFGEGASPLLRAERYGRSMGLDALWVKQCGTSHTGSFKDLGMTVLVSAVKEMIRRGRGLRAVACASTGDTSAALAAYGAAAGVPTLVLLPRNKVSLAQLLQPLANGALVLSLDTDFDGCMTVVQALAEDGTVYLANSMNSLRIEGQKTVAVEIAQQLGWRAPDWVVIPGGNLGNVYALGKGFLLMKALGLIDRLPRICVAQAERANPLYQAFVRGWAHYEPIAARSTAASAIQIGAPVSIARAIRVLTATDGVVEQASEDELADAVARADRTGMYTCPHTGVALAALEKLVARGLVTGGQEVVVVSTAHGLKFTEFKRAYHEGALEGATARHRNVPIELPASLDAVRRSIDTHLERLRPPAGDLHERSRED